MGGNFEKKNLEKVDKNLGPQKKRKLFLLFHKENQFEYFHPGGGAGTVGGI